MTPDEEARFIALWNAGTETAEISRLMGIPPGTVSSRAHALQARGLIQARPRGGAHARRVSQARTSPPVQSSAVSRRAVQNSAEPTWERILQELQAIKAAVQNSAVPVQSSAESFDDPDDAKPGRWNLWIPQGLRRRIEALAAGRGIAASKVVQELLWKALTETPCQRPPEEGR